MNTTSPSVDPGHKFVAVFSGFALVVVLVVIVVVVVVVLVVLVVVVQR